MKLRLKGGDKIIHKGAEFIVRKKSELNASPVLAAGEEETEEDFEQGEAKGNRQSDVPDPIDRRKAVELLKDYLSTLEEHQSDLMRAEAFRDDELEDLEQPIGTDYKASIYAASVVYISELETLVENLGKL